MVASSCSPSRGDRRSPRQALAGSRRVCDSLVRMSDARDGVDEAVRANRLLLARLQVRDDALDEEIRILTVERITATGELYEVLGAKIAELGQERAAIAVEREATARELGALAKLAGKLPVIEAQTLAREALALAGVDPEAPPPPTGRLSEADLRAQLAAMKAQRTGAGAAVDDPTPADPEPPPDEGAPRKRTL